MIHSPSTLLCLPSFLMGGVAPTDSSAAAEFRTLLAMGRVQRVLVAFPETFRDRALLQRPGLTPDGLAGGVAVWVVSPSESAGPTLGPPAQFRLILSTRIQVLRSDLAEVETAAARYLSQGGRANTLSLARLEQTNLLPLSQGHRPMPVAGWQATWWGVWLKSSPNQGFSLGIRDVP